MQNCPGCQMLMEDAEALCPPCTAERSASSSGGFDLPLVAAGPQRAATAVLERPTVAPTPTTLKYRVRGGRRRGRGALAVLFLLLGAFGALVATAARGQGPLAEAAVEAGLVEPPVVSVPGAWSAASSTAGGFTAALPAGAERIEVPIDAANPAAGVIHGYETQLGEGGSTKVLGVDLGPRPDVIGAATDDAAFASLIDWMVAWLGGSTGTATETVRRDVRVGNGRAVDVVVLDEAEGVTARARYHLIGSRFLGVVTTGLDAGADELDEVHARVLGSFSPTE